MVLSSLSMALPSYQAAYVRHEKGLPSQASRCVGMSNKGRVMGIESRQAVPKASCTRRCDCLDLHKELIPYPQAWSWQKSILSRRLSLVDLNSDNSDAVISLQHPSVYTLGTGSSKSYIKFDMKNPPFNVYRTERGGEVTFHGPGQLVMYPIINLRYQKMDLNWYLRSLEEVVIRALSSTFGINASRCEGLTGVWVGNHKVAAIGIRASRWVTFHGLALNVATDLDPFRHIIPCGIHDREVGSLDVLLQQNSLSEEAAAALLDAAHESLLAEFSEVFQLSLKRRSVGDFGILDKDEPRPSMKRQEAGDGPTARG